MSEVKPKSRLALAQGFRQSADHSSEQELWNVLSRPYYSVYHAGRALIGKERGTLTHGDLQKNLANTDRELADRV